MPNCSKCGKPITSTIVTCEGCRGWISVKDRLPEEFGQRVVISWDTYADIATYWRGIACPHWRTQHYGTVGLTIVTHWMPLPQLPKEDAP